MKLSAFTQQLAGHASHPVGFVFDDGEMIPQHFHLSEIGYITKNFVDGTGSIRKVELVQLQVWLGDDEPCPLTGAELAQLLDVAKHQLPSGDLDVEVEYEGCVISQYAVEAALDTGTKLLFQLADKRMDSPAKSVAAAGTASCNGSTGCC